MLEELGAMELGEPGEAKTTVLEFLAVAEARKAIFWPTLSLEKTSLDSSGLIIEQILTSTSAVPHRWESEYILKWVRQQQPDE